MVEDLLDPELADEIAQQQEAQGNHGNLQGFHAVSSRLTAGAGSEAVCGSAAR